MPTDTLPLLPKLRRRLPTLFLLLSLLRRQRTLSLSLSPSLLPHLTLLPHIMVIQLLLILVTELPGLLLQDTLRSIELCSARLLRRALLGLTLEPRPLGTALDLILVYHDVLTALELHLGLRELLIFLLFLENLDNLVGHVVDFLGPGISFGSIDDTTGDLGALGSAGFDGLLNDFAVRLSGEGARATSTTSTSCTSNSVKVDLVGLRCFVVDDCVDALDIQTTGSKISGEEEGDFAITEGLHTGDTLKI